MKTIDLVKKFYECFGKGDLPGVLQCLSANVKWKLVGPSTIPYFGEYTGTEGVRNFFANLFEVEDVLEFIPEQFIDGGDSVVVRGRERCRAKNTGKEFSVEWAQVFESKDGVITEWCEYIDTASIEDAYKG